MIAQVSPVILAFGANLGDRISTIRDAQSALAHHPAITEFTPSPLRETVAVTLEGPDETAPKYLNGVASAVTTLAPLHLLDLVQELEQQFGRTREVRWGARTLDIDIITFAGKVIRDERLTLPHPRAHERDFVLAPWLDLDPGAVLMRHGRVADLLDRVGDTTTPYRGEDPGISGISRPQTESEST
ncbi:MAG: 2-amino-4-hydroxy-6-hydroxymethyldihydropteridine diphosphokinase [Canibacter sp.]